MPFASVLICLTYRLKVLFHNLQNLGQIWCHWNRLTEYQAPQQIRQLSLS